MLTSLILAAATYQPPTVTDVAATIRGLATESPVSVVADEPLGVFGGTQPPFVDQIDKVVSAEGNVYVIFQPTDGFAVTVIHWKSGGTTWFTVDVLKRNR